MTVPVTLLLACTSVFGRMSGANEVVAAKALGIKPMVLLRPALGLALILSLLTVWLNDLAASWGRNGMRQVVIDAVDDIVYSLLRSQHSYSSPFFSINVKQVEGRRLLGVTLSLRARGNSPAATITAEEAVLQSNLAEGMLKIILRNGNMDVAGKVSGQFPDTYEREIPLTDASRANNTDSRPASWLPLRVIAGEVVKQRANIERCDQEMAAQAAYQMLCGDFDQLTGPQWAGLAAGRAEQQSVIYRLLTEPPRRWSWGFSCFCFAWVGTPIAIRLRNRDFLTSFFLCFLPILVVYYPLLIFGINGAKGGTLPCYSRWCDTE
jgi:lipopolysaccharide export system permease protein